MAKIALVTEEINAGLDLIRRFAQHVPVQSAFWLKPLDDDDHYLYLASANTTSTNFDLAYGEIHRFTLETESIWLDYFRVRVLSSDEPLA